MAVATTYPGVYVQELPSSVRTIAGVSTSVTAFVGAAKRGPINKAVNVLNYGDFERRFGGLAAGLEMPYAVRQFFLNGGSNAWIVRVAVADKAELVLKFGAGGTNDNALRIRALDEGKSGNFIKVSVDHKTLNPASTFNLTLTYTDPDDKTISVTETFLNLSMNSSDARYFKTVVNNVSKLVTLESEPLQTATASALDAKKGTSVGGKLLNSSNALIDVATQIDATHNQFRVSANGLSPVTITLAAGDIMGTTEDDHLKSLASLIEGKVRAASSEPAYNLMTVTPTATAANTIVTSADHLEFTSGAGGEKSSVRILPGERNDVSARLKLGTVNGGVEADAVAMLRPNAEIPPAGKFTGAAISGDTTLDELPSATEKTFTLSLNGGAPQTVELDTSSPTSKTDNIAADLNKLKTLIENKVRSLAPSNPAYTNFTVTVVGNAFVFTSGTQGADSSVRVSKAGSDTLADKLGLTATGAAFVDGKDITLAEGKEDPYVEKYELYSASRADRKGLYALEGIDFNLLCLSGVTNSGILQDAAAYCEERRAFLIVDAPLGKSPDEMATLIASPTLPKSTYAAVFYPWVQIADPLMGGKLRSVPPSGTVAGVMARTDSTRGVWKAPAGTDAALRGVQGMEYALTDGQNGVLNPRGVNCLRLLPVYGAVAWGARTLRGDDQFADQWKYIPVRRLALYIEESLYRGTQWVVFEPNDESLWAQIRLNVGAFMNNLFRQGAFQGETAREAYFVKCDSETTTQNDIDLGIVNILVGFMPLKPAEFVIISIQQMAGDIQV